MMFVVGRLSGKVQPKYLIIAGAIVAALSMYDLTRVYGDVGFWFFATSRMLLGIGLPLIFLSIMTASYDGIPPDKTDQASALINAARNTGGSIGVSLAVNVLAHREQFHQMRLAEHAIPSSVQYQNTLQQVTSYFTAHGSSLAQAQQQAVAWIGQAVQTQATLLAYVDVYWVLMLVSLAAIPLALTLRKVKLWKNRCGRALIGRLPHHPWGTWRIWHGELYHLQRQLSLLFKQAVQVWAAPRKSSADRRMPRSRKTSNTTTTTNMAVVVHPCDVTGVAPYPKRLGSNHGLPTFALM